MEDKDVYSILTQLQNELEDDLKLDLGEGECGYASYEESYKAVRKYTLRKIKTMANRLKRKMEKSSDTEKEKFYCQKCKEEVKFGDKSCKKCGSQQLWALFG